MIDREGRPQMTRIKRDSRRSNTCLDHSQRNVAVERWNSCLRKSVKSASSAAPVGVCSVHIQEFIRAQQHLTEGGEGALRGRGDGLAFLGRRLTGGLLSEDGGLFGEEGLRR